MYGDGVWGSCCPHTHARTLNGCRTSGVRLSVQTHHLALNAAQVDYVKIAGQDRPERGIGLQRRNASSFWDYWQRQDLMVQEGAGHVTENGGEVGRCGVHHLYGGRGSQQEVRSNWFIYHCCTTGELMHVSLWKMPD